MRRHEHPHHSSPKNSLLLLLSSSSSLINVFFSLDFDFSSPLVKACSVYTTHYASSHYRMNIKPFYNISPKFLLPPPGWGKAQERCVCFMAGRQRERLWLIAQTLFLLASQQPPQDSRPCLPLPYNLVTFLLLCLAMASYMHTYRASLPHKYI